MNKTRVVHTIFFRRYVIKEEITAESFILENAIGTINFAVHRRQLSVPRLRFT